MVNSKPTPGSADTLAMLPLTGASSAYSGYAFVVHLSPSRSSVPIRGELSPPRSSVPIRGELSPPRSSVPIRGKLFPTVIIRANPWQTLSAPIRVHLWQNPPIPQPPPVRAARPRFPAPSRPRTGFPRPRAREGHPPLPVHARGAPA